MKPIIYRVILWIYMLFFFFATPAYAVLDKVLYDDYANASFSQFFLINESTDLAFQGQHSLMVKPNMWQTPYIRIAAGRTDFRPFDVLEFFVRSPYAQVSPQLVAYDYADSNTITVTAYTQGNVIDNTWRKVSIPIADMVSPTFAMDSVFVMRFLTMQKSTPFYIDNITLRSTSTPVLTGLETRSNRSVTLKFKNFSIPLTKAGVYSVQSIDDPNYLLAQPVTRFGIDRQAISTPTPGPGRNPNSSTNESRLHLLLPFPMQTGKHYQVDYRGVRRDNGFVSAQALKTFIYDPTTVNGSVQVNQVGYMPSAPKRALVGNWLGTAGAMPIDTYSFQVVDAYSQAIAFQGTLTARAVPDEESGNNVYLADFSSLTQTGRYYLNVPSVGRSYTFDIQPDVFESVYRTTMRLLYHKRNSALIAPYVDAGRERTAGVSPQLDGVFIPDMYASPLSNGEQVGEFKQIEPGWFDAGDLGEYITNQAPIWSSISLAMDLAAPNSFQDGELNIPESGNGIPDILDELSWGSRWALSMQDQRDGGVYWRICSKSWDYVPPAQLSQPRHIYEKTTVATAQFSAMMAIYARLIAPYDAYAAVNAKKAAIHAWDYIQTHVAWPAEGSVYHNPPSGGCGEYPVNSSKGAQSWAAAELYRLTGKNKYQQAYETIFGSIPNPQAANMYPSDITDAGWAMLMSNHPNRDPYLTQLGRKWIMFAADSMLERMNAHPFYSTKHPAIVFTGWHSFSASAISATKLFQGYYITHDTKYRDAAWVTPNIELGTNPQNRSYLVGVGYNPPLHPLDTSFTDPYAAVIRGGLVPGVTYHLPGFRQPYIAVNNAYYPPESTGNPTPWISNNWFAAYPVLRRYTDAHLLIPMAESTVKEETWNAVSFALMRNENLATQTSPTAYPWPRKRSFMGIFFAHIPIADVPLLSPTRIQTFGAAVTNAPQAWLAALTPEQVGAINAPNQFNWVGKLSATQKKGLTPAQISTFTNGTLFLDVLPEQVPLIPISGLRTLKANLLPVNNAAWMQQLTLLQLQEIQTWSILNWQTNLTQIQKSLLAGTLIDTQPPVINLSGPVSIRIPQGTRYVDPGATAQDNIDGNVTASIITTNPVDTTAVGTYTIRYNVQDTAGNAATPLTRKVVVTAATTPSVTLLSAINSGLNATTNVTVPSMAVINNMGNGATLAGTSQTFSWMDTGASAYRLLVGAKLGGAGFFDSGTLPAGTTSVSAVGLPQKGVPVYVRLYAWVGGAWVKSDQIYLGAAKAIATISRPANGAILTATSQTFSWVDTGADKYFLMIGNFVVGGSDLYSSGVLTAGTTSVTVTGLPNDGSIIHARLYTWGNGAWQTSDTSYMARPSTAYVTIPINGAILSAPSQTFSWVDTGAPFYYFIVGTAFGRADIHQSGNLAAGTTLVNATGLPTGSVPIYVRLYSWGNGGWNVSNATYTSAP